jgi:hypothetical protein
LFTQQSYDYLSGFARQIETRVKEAFVIWNKIKNERNIPPKAVIILNFCLSLLCHDEFQLLCFCSTKVSEISDMTNFLATFCCSGT